MQNLISWFEPLDSFLISAKNNNLKMILVGGAAVNFHGYQRNSADIDIWVNPDEENLKNLLKVLNESGFELDELPKSVIEANQNVSVKFTPDAMNVELITRFDVNRTFLEAYNEAELFYLNSNKSTFIKVLNINDLIISKIKSGRPKDFLDILEIKRIKNIK